MENEVIPARYQCPCKAEAQEAVIERQNAAFAEFARKNPTQIVWVGGTNK